MFAIFAQKIATIEQNRVTALPNGTPFILEYIRFMDAIMSANAERTSAIIAILALFFI